MLPDVYRMSVHQGAETELTAGGVMVSDKLPSEPSIIDPFAPHAQTLR